MGGGSLDAGQLERFSQNLIRARWCAGASNGGSGGGRGINKSRQRGNAKMSASDRKSSITGIVLVWSLPLVLAKASVNCRTESARVRVDIPDPQGTNFGNPTGGVETNSKERVMATGKQTFVEQKLDFLLVRVD